jgi:type IV secretion system protein VirB4
MALYESFFQFWHWTPRFLSDVTPWRMLAAPGVLLAKDRNALLRTYVVRGQDLMGTTPEQQGAIMLQANNVFKRLGGQWVLHAEAQRTALTEYPPMLATAPQVARRIDASRRTQMLDAPGARETRYYLTVTWMPPDPATRAIRRLLLTGPTQAPGGGTEEALRQFVRESDALMGLLRGVLATVRPATTPELLTYLHTTVSERWHAIQRLANALDIDTQLCDTPYWGGWAPQLGSRHLRTCSIIGYPAQSTAWIMRDLETRDLDFRWVTRWIGLERQAQAGLLRKTQHQWIHQEKSLGTRISEQWSGQAARVKDSDATNKANEADAARQELGADIVAYGQFSSTVTVWDTDPQMADEKLASVMEAFNAKGFMMTAETVHATAAWLSSLPGNRLDNVRRRPQQSLTLAHLLPGMAAAWTGEPWDTHLNAPPWFLAHTEQSSVFRQVATVEEVGHAMILGPTRRGKSVFCAFLVAQWLARYERAQCFWFDVDKSARLPTLLLGGHWYDLGGGDLRFQPLRDLDTPVDRAWAVGWLTALCRDALVPITGEVQAYLGAGCRRLAERPKSERTLTTLMGLLSDHSRQVDLSAKAGRHDAQGIAHPDQRLEALGSLQRQVQTALRPFTTAGDYGWLLDANTDDLQEGSLHTFEQHALLTMPMLVGPVTRYIFHRLEQRFSTDTPTWLPNDEAAITWALPDFEKKGKEWMMTTAKKNVSLGFFTHSLSQVFESPLGPLLMESCPSRYFLSNPAAKEPKMAKVYEQLGLTADEILTIATMQPYRDYYFSCELTGKRVFHLPLSEDILALLARNTAADHARIDTLLARVGHEGFTAAWLESEKDEGWTDTEEMRDDL